MVKVLIVEARFYKDMADEGLEAAKNILLAHNISYDVITVPGALEIPHAMNIALENEDYAGVIALGCIIKGETSHYDVISDECLRCVNDIAIPYGLPVGFGVVMANNKQQAIDRVKAYAERAAIACIELIGIKSRFSQGINERIPQYQN